MTERVLALHGELDLASRDDLHARLAALDDGEPLVVDLGGVDFVDIQSLVLLSGRRGETTIRNGQPVVDRVLGLLASQRIAVPAGA